mgnify:CR=1 FL=1
MKSGFPALLAQALLSLIMVLAALMLYDRQVVGPALRIGVVDVAEIYRQKETEFTRLITKASTDEDRQRALAMARDFAQRLPVALEELPRECACLVVLKGALAGTSPQMVDLTPRLRQKVGMP